MSSLNDIMQNHQICALQNRLRKRLILNSFNKWIEPSHFTDWHLSLYRFTTLRPFMYLSHSALNHVLQFFRNHRDLVLDNLATLEHEITHAIFSMTRLGSSWGQEDVLSLGEPRDLINFERIWHPEYQRYCEHIFNHLIRIPLEILGRLKNKNYQALSLANRVEILENNGLAELTKGYNATVRNAISHGYSLFEFQSIRYIDSRTEVQLTGSEFAEIFDELVDTCHATIIALLLFLCENQKEVTKRGLDLLPLGIKYLLVDGVASYRGFKIHSMVESKTIKGEKQLNIFCSSVSSARVVHIFESLHVSWNSLKFGGGHYARFGVSIDCGKLISATAFLNGKRLLEVIQNKLPPESAKGVFEASLLWYDTSKWLRKIYNLKNIFSISLPITKFQIYDEWRKLGLQVLCSRYIIRKSINKSAGKLRRLEALIVLTESEVPSKDVLLNIARHAVRKLKKKAIPKVEIGTIGKIKRLPSYVWVRLYRHDRRIRTLMSTGWLDGNLLLWAEWVSIRYRQKPVFIKSPDVIFRGIRVKFNPQVSFE